MLIIHMYIYLYIHNIKLIKMQNLSQLVSAVGCPQEKHVCFQWRNKVTNLMPGVRHCDVVFDVSSAYDFQRNRCIRNAEMLGIWEIQFGIESMWLYILVPYTKLAWVDSNPRRLPYNVPALTDWAIWLTMRCGYWSTGSSDLKAQVIVRLIVVAEFNWQLLLTNFGQLTASVVTLISWIYFIGS